LAAGEQAGVIAMLLKQINDLTDCLGLDVVKRSCFHRGALSRSQ
jgi:hypothetical protein